MYNSNCSFENGGIAQLARACGSYPQCPRFESRCRYHKRRSINTAPFIRPVGQAVKTPPFHGGNMGSIPVRVTKKKQFTYKWTASSVLLPFQLSDLFTNPFRDTNVPVK